MNSFTKISKAWLKHKFDKKVKLIINRTLMRVVIIKRRRSSMLNYLRSDIAELLRAGHDSDAFKRVGRLYVDENRSVGYDFVERYCTLILEKLSMNDWCHDECKEAVSSLMYAAAILGDIPELRGLRSLFFDKYGSSLESFVSQEFIEKLKPDHCLTKAMRIRLMQEIAQEHGVGWSGTVGDDQDNVTRITDKKNSWMVNVQEMNDNQNDEECLLKMAAKDHLDSMVSSHQPRHVHPKLPDYDDIVAQFASTRKQTRNDNNHNVGKWDEEKAHQPRHVHPKLPDYDNIVAQFALTRKQTTNDNNHNVGKWDGEKAIVESYVKKVHSLVNDESSIGTCSSYDFDDMVGLDRYKTKNIKPLDIMVY